MSSIDLYYTLCIECSILCRYPLKAAKYLEKTLKKNRTMLKNLKTDIPKKEINVGDCDADSNIRVEEQLNKISEDIGYCR